MNCSAWKNSRRNRHTIKPGTPEHGRTEHHWNTPKYQQNTNVTPVDRPETREPYKAKNNCRDFKENLNFILMHLTHSTQSGNIFYY